MATSSFSRDFVVSNPKSIEQLIQALENPTKIHLEKRNQEKEIEKKEEILCRLKERIISMK